MAYEFVNNHGDSTRQHFTSAFNKQFSSFWAWPLENLAQVGAAAPENKDARATLPLDRNLAIRNLAIRIIGIGIPYTARS